MEPQCVIDSSVWLKFFIPEVDSAAAEELIRGQPSYLVPDLLFAEFANALWVKCRFRDLSSARAEEAIVALQAFRSGMIVVSSAELAPDALELALELNHPAYDCIYLALAERAGLAFVTADRTLYRTVRQRSRGRAIRLLT